MGLNPHKKRKKNKFWNNRYHPKTTPLANLLQHACQQLHNTIISLKIFPFEGFSLMCESKTSCCKVNLLSSITPKYCNWNVERRKKKCFLLFHAYNVWTKILKFFQNNNKYSIRLIMPKHKKQWSQRSVCFGYQHK